MTLSKLVQVHVSSSQILVTTEHGYLCSSQSYTCSLYGMEYQLSATRFSTTHWLETELLEGFAICVITATAVVVRFRLLSCARSLFI